MVDKSERGKIRNKKRRQQIVDFSGIRYKNITPTDIEGLGYFFNIKGFFEIQNKVFIFIELKLAGTELLRGQTLAFARLVDALKYPAIYIIGEHNVENAEQEIVAAECIVTQYRSHSEWFIPKEEITLKRLIDKFLEHHNLHNLYGPNSEK